MRCEEHPTAVHRLEIGSMCIPYNICTKCGLNIYSELGRLTLNNSGNIKYFDRQDQTIEQHVIHLTELIVNA